MDVDTRLLRYFAAVAAEGNLTRAAERLFVSQPALTRQIKQLESQLGVQLFTRSAAGMTLTAAGQALAGAIPAVLAGWDQALRETKTAASRAVRVLRVGFISSAANEATQQIIAAFARRWPGWRWRDYWLATSERQGHPARIGAVTDQPDTWLTAIANGDGIALAPESAARYYARPPASPTGPSPASAPARSASPGRPPTTPTPSSRTSSAAAWTTSRHNTSRVNLTSTNSQIPALPITTTSRNVTASRIVAHKTEPPLAD